MANLWIGAAAACISAVPSSACSSGSEPADGGLASGLTASPSVSAKPVANDTAPIGRWTWTSPSDRSRPTFLLVRRDGTLQGQDSCNEVAGNWASVESAHGFQVKSLGISTLVACLGSESKRRQRAFADAAYLKVSGAKLLLLDDSGARLAMLGRD
jgi:heat shock protein HslJ